MTPLTVAMTCTSCGHLNREDARFCGHCGSSLDSPLHATDGSRPGSNPYILKIKEWFGPQAIPFMLSGALLVFFAQWVFFTAEFQPAAPRHGVYILVFGVLFFALGAYAYAEKYKSENRIGSLLLTAEPTRMPLFRYATLFWG